MSYLKTMSGEDVGKEIEILKRTRGISAREAADWLDKFGSMPTIQDITVATNGWKPAN